LDEELRAFGLSTPADACSLWYPSMNSGTTNKPPEALHDALWVFLGAVSAARLAASSLLDAR